MRLGEDSIFPKLALMATRVSLLTTETEQGKKDAHHESVVECLSHDHDGFRVREYAIDKQV